MVKVSWTDKKVRSSLKVLSVYFVIFFLYSTGFVWVVAEGHSGSISLGQESIKKYGDATDKNCFYAMCYPEQDIFGVKWISKKRDNKSRIYADFTRKTLVFASYGMMLGEHQLTNTTKVREDSYIYLGYPNVRYGLMYYPYQPKTYWNLTDISPLLNEKSIIYTNGGSEIYK